MEHFNDERINGECGAIYRRGIVLAVAVTAVWTLLRGMMLAAVGELRSVWLLTELAILLSGGGILLIGVIRFRGRQEERVQFERHRYYLGAGKVFLVCALSGYAASIPFAFRKTFSDVPTNHLILVLEVLGTLYLFYAFKRRRIAFNYTFISEEKPVYYRTAFARIRTMCEVLLVVFGFAMMLDFGVNRSFASFFSILLGYGFSCLGLGIDYFFLSWLEKRAYDEEKPRGLNSGTVGAFAVLLFVTLSHSVLDVGYTVLAAGDLQALGGNAGEILASIAYARLYVGYLVSLFAAMALGHYLAQAGGKAAMRRSICGMFWMLGLSVVSGFVSSFMSGILSHAEMAGAVEQEVLLAWADGHNAVYRLGTAASLILLLFFVRQTVRQGAPRALWAVVAVQAAAWVLPIAVTANEARAAVCVAVEVLEIGAMTLGFCLMRRHTVSETAENG